MDGAGEFDEASALKNLTENVRNQDDLERDITEQANRALIEVEDKRDRKRIEKAELSKLRLENQRRTQQQKLQAATGGSTARLRTQQEITRIEAEIQIYSTDISDFNSRIEQRNRQSKTDNTSSTTGRKLSNESQREYLIRTGKITPFAKIGGPRPDGIQGDLANAIIDAEDEAVAEEIEEQGADGPRSHQNLRLPGFAEENDYTGGVAEDEFSLRPRKKRRVQQDAASLDEFAPNQSTSEAATPASYASDISDEVDMTDMRPKVKSKKGTTKESEDKIDLSGIDDGSETVYQSRLKDWTDRRSRARRRRQEALGQPIGDAADGVDEWLKPSPDEADHEFENGLKLPGDIYPSLFDYQKTGVQWLAELYAQQVGGIVGDEMGLGKTVQLISFVAALHHSNILNKPTIVVAPATVLRQWVNEFHRWWPPLRVSILHSSGSGMFNVRNEGEIEDQDDVWDKKKPSKSSKAAKKIVDRVVKHGHVLVTTYAGLQTYSDVLIPVDWGYAVLDEGHKIRNPNTAITIYCKELRTPNRMILSGTPMQNNLTELWSLFDFIYPMRLGTLVAFRNQFEIPIRLGGYANATNLQIMTAQKCAETLKETISPYLLQRLKVDVAADLPKKSEQVLFCKLSKQQREAYELFLKSDDMASILSRSRQSLYGIDILRKICNHPDLLDPRLKTKPGYLWGSANKSGKMAVVKSLLPMWKRLGHKTLLFCQGVQMLDVLEAFIRRQDGISYIRMDGKTPVKQRQTLVDQFNNDPDLDVFLLTTKVGGLGVNLTGANRVIIFDPDWNPSTDVQARERAWRLGQKKEVTIYRLMTAGTIEEKIYHRQIFKQFLSNKVLKDPKQQTNFNLHDLHDLFTLSSYEDGTTETGELFKGSEVKSFKPVEPRELILPSHDATPFRAPPVSVAKGGERGGNGNEEGELRNIDGVAGLETFQDEKAPPANEEDRLMEGIFARSGVHSALEHDEIMNGKRSVKADRKMLQLEANRIAAQAALGLRRAGEAARNVPIGTVTWTGEFGEAGRPVNIRRGRAGPSSAGILAGIENRQALSIPSAGSSRSGTPSAADRNLKAKDFEKMVPAFIKRHGGQVPSKLLVDHFNHYCAGAKQAEEFKTALAKVAKMDKRGSSMRAIWTLRSEYQ
ncbi:SNF2 family N-terminal domain-containing protein [Lasiosphaeria miniovina]|uniref:SNF2 family N-terminal domain-containing protein n=1 Tax=Lasiosphaeria miniovina TaxID=1954250 RepID=A0AA40A4L8_9PEZI|nr:SNF2 family N-terminal domain-containing protein [Lasiosphaeria miniovina]KAK0709165.1 SNF2 family N-terminal domain-containing protein [Lasiosphaeria miniovina]